MKGRRRTDFPRYSCIDINVSQGLRKQLSRCWSSRSYWRSMPGVRGLKLLRSTGARRSAGTGQNLYSSTPRRQFAACVSSILCQQTDSIERARWWREPPRMRCRDVCICRTDVATATRQAICCRGGDASVGHVGVKKPAPCEFGTRQMQDPRSSVQVVLRGTPLARRVEPGGARPLTLL